VLVGGGRWADVSGRWVRGSRWGANRFYCSHSGEGVMLFWT